MNKLIYALLTFLMASTAANASGQDSIWKCAPALRTSDLDLARKHAANIIILSPVFGETARTIAIDCLNFSFGNGWLYDKSINSFINLPDVISSSRDIYNFEINVSKGNFINKGSVITKTVIYKKGLDLNSLNDKIVLVENADPGYDFLFTYNIKGLITKYGGPNSHMAIRCLEENILACIGYGSLFNEINDNQNLKLDCDNKKIHI